VYIAVLCTFSNDLLCRHYKNTVNKLRSDIKEEYTKIESNFFSVPKLRGADVCGRDKWQWYRETDAEAQVSYHQSSVPCVLHLMHSFAEIEVRYFEWNFWVSTTASREVHR
jgi:hypothetical protein